MKRSKAAFTGPHLEVLASIVRSIPDTDVRAIMANHFGQEFLRRLASFDAERWGADAGGKLMGPTSLYPTQRAPE